MNSKVDQKRNWIKLKPVRTLLRISCLADRKSYVVNISANSCEKLTKCENVSSWCQFKLQTLLKIACYPIGSHMWSLYMPILSKVHKKKNWVKFKSIQILLKITSIVPTKSYLLIIYTNSLSYLDLTSKGNHRSSNSKVKDHEANWKTIYMTYYTVGQKAMWQQVFRQQFRFNSFSFQHVWV